MTIALGDALNDLLKLGGEVDWLRSPIVRGLSAADGRPRIDREARTISGFAVITKGPAIGHNMDIDDTFLDQVVSAGNQAKSGIKSRFDHPNASSTSIGTALGRAKNFRRDGDVVRADLHILESASKAPDGDLGGYVMGLAEEDPEAFGASIVFHADKLKRTDEAGAPLPDVPRLTKLMAADVVDDPAANPTGMFSRDSLAEKVTTFLDRYFESTIKTTIQQEVRAMSAATPTETTPTAEQLTAATNEGRKAERERVNAIHKLCKDMKTESLAAELIELGATLDEATKTCKLRRLSVMEREAPESAGGGQESDKASTEFSALPEGEDRWKKEFAASPAIQDEFLGKESTYLSFKRAEFNGQVKIHRKIA